MRVLVACEFSGTVRDAFVALGHEAVSCDLLPTEKPGAHHLGDVREILHDGWDLMVAHPPCQFLTVSGNKWMRPEFADRFPDRPYQRQRAIEFFLELFNAPIPRVAVENPVGVMSSAFRRPDQYVQPFMFGDPVRKKTGLWLRGLPLLEPTDPVDPVVVALQNGRGTDSAWHMTAPSPDRWKLRSKTYPGLARAMADQWGGV